MMGETRHEEVEYREDKVPTGFVFAIITAAVTITVVLCLLATWLLHVRERALRPSGVFPEAHLPAPHEVAHVRAAPFEIPEPEPGVLERQRVLLDSYGWVDQSRRIVRIPVARAAELMLRQQKGAQP